MLGKYTKPKETKLNVNQHAYCICKNCLYVCAYDCVQLWYTIQH